MERFMSSKDEVDPGAGTTRPREIDRKLEELGEIEFGTDRPGVCEGEEQHGAGAGRAGPGDAVATEKPLLHAGSRAEDIHKTKDVASQPVRSGGWTGWRSDGREGAWTRKKSSAAQLEVVAKLWWLALLAS
ncbi:hypothetical protein DTO280E4_5178 [Paecilomyces variotii]|nr:hypothetical protein DTO032I3_3514 [Paecilomyces variotii]KAJ9276824.1 hypothetical protein DTO021D3_6261 [Paecilomyces variotii]KAJ9338420.1 hypothetical protein DTO027B6_9020 [Paecilomyces variotii]KAJ9358419.1 hypothetical protein DTO280E4_5178 [Paecilomyces variotii]KAJ9380698.1 hypothetical protein DTO032I4_6519 [Paecilomyces variotii]